MHGAACSRPPSWDGAQRMLARDDLIRRRFHPDAGSMRTSCQRAQRPAGGVSAGRTCRVLLTPNGQRRMVAIAGCSDGEVEVNIDVDLISVPDRHRSAAHRQGRRLR